MAKTPEGSPESTGRESSSFLAPLVAEIMREATRRAGKALALSLQLEALVGRSYSDRTVSAWNRGAIMPPADVLLAAAQASGISVDEKLGVGRQPSEVEQEVAELRKDIDEQAKSLAFLYQRLEDEGISLDATRGERRDDARGATGTG